MQILLAYTAATSSGNRDVGAFETLLPIGLCSLHGLLRSRNLPATLANLSGSSDAEITRLLHRISPTLVGLSQWTHNRHETIRAARLIKRTLPDCLVILGGGHATHQAELILQCHPEVDLIVLGEGEQTLLELLSALEDSRELTTVPGLAMRSQGGVIRTAPRSAWTDLDQLPFPATYLHEALQTDVRLQAEFISSSRGCPAACSFCASPAFWGRTLRFRSATSVVAEMRFIQEQFGLTYLSLRDDTFTADRRRTVALCRELIEQQLRLFWNCQSRVEAIDAETLHWMRLAGCECIQLGVESGSPTMLQLLGKHIKTEQVIRAAELIHQAGLHLSVFLITGIPEERDDDRQQTVNLIKQIRPDDLQVAPLAYYPGTALFESGLRAGRYPADIFETAHDEAVLACPDGQTQVDRLLKRLVRFRHRLQPSHLQTLQQENGFSPVTAMQLGDWHLAAGDPPRAEAQYRAITIKQPDHPWGWQLLGELCEQQGRRREAANCYQKLLQLVPRHSAAREALQRLGHKKGG